MFSMATSNTPSPEFLLARYFNELRMNNWADETIRCKSYYIGIFLDLASQRGARTRQRVHPRAAASLPAVLVPSSESANRKTTHF